MALTHYIVVRRDLPFGILAAQVAHAAGESFYAFALPKVTFSNRTMASGGYAAAAPSGPSSSVSESQTFFFPSSSETPPFVAAETIAVVLGARNEGKLARLELELTGAAIPHVVVREVNGEYAGQLMAIGLLPGEKDTLAPYVNDFQMLPRLA